MMIVREVIERETPSSSSSSPPASPRPSQTGLNGFPSALHRSYKAHKSTSASSCGWKNEQDHARDENVPGKVLSKNEETSVVRIYHVGGTIGVGNEAGPSRLPASLTGLPGGETDVISKEVVQENWQKIREMDKEQREEERKELEERFGSRVMNALRKRAKEKSEGRVGDGAFGESTAGSCFLQGLG